MRRRVSFQAILSETEAFLKWFTAIVVCFASCSCFGHTSRLVVFGYTQLQALGEVGRPTKGKGTLKSYLIFYLERCQQDVAFYSFLPLRHNVSPRIGTDGGREG